MYLRHTIRKKDGKVHRYWTLVRSVRIGRRVIQQTVAQLGELDEHGRIEALAFARRVIGAPEEASLFDDGSEYLTAPVRLKGVRVERSRQFGDVYLALCLWRGMGLEDLCRRLLPIGQERVAWAKMAAVLVTARLCEPSSELHIAEDWYRRTALCDLLQLGDAEVNKDRLYRGLDRLLAHKQALEAHLAARCGELFAVENDVLLYDVTSTYFEGQAEANPQAQRGYSRDHRPDCKQVLIALVVTFDGFPLGYEVFAGNTHDSRTVQTIVAAMEARHGALGRVWIADRGMASAENLAWLRQTGRRYIIGAPKSQLKTFSGELARKEGWRTVQDGVEVKLARDPETAETVILCRSEDRRSKERAMHDKFSRRIEQALERVSARIAHARKPLDPAAINRQIGRILQKNQRAAARFAIALEPDAGLAGLRLRVDHDAAFDDWAALSEGAYLLRSNVGDWSDRQLWKAYIQLTQAEAAFRIQKDQLSLRPIWHQREDRVQAHILVCFLAFALWKSLEMWQERAGLGNSPRTVLEELARIQSHDVVLPTAAHGEIRLRCVAQPDAAQAALLDRLGVNLPKRMRPPENEPLALSA
jgi:transposase